MNEKSVLHLFKMFLVYIVIKITSKILYKLKKKTGLYFEYTALSSTLISQ